jgi:HSP20 family protein
MTQFSQWIPESWRELLAHLRDEMHEIIERWLPRRNHDMDSRHEAVTVQRAALTEGLTTFWSPSPFLSQGQGIDVDETDDAVVLMAEFPGLDPKDFTVEVTGEGVVIRGEKRRATSHTGRGYSYSEQRYGAFARALRLPCEVDPNQAHATYTQGLLRVTLPKTARAKASRRKVRVQDEYRLV